MKRDRSSAGDPFASTAYPRAMGGTPPAPEWMLFI